MTSDRPAAAPAPQGADAPQPLPELPANGVPTPPAPPLAPDATSPWWHAPGGKPVDIPAFG